MTTEVVSLRDRGIGTDTDRAGCRRVRKSQEHTTPDMFLSSSVFLVEIQHNNNLRTKSLHLICFVQQKCYFSQQVPPLLGVLIYGIYALLQQVAVRLPQLIAAAAAVGLTRSGSASPYARLVGLTLAPFVRVHTHTYCSTYPVLSFFTRMFPASLLESRHNIFETNTLHGMSNKSFS